MTTESADRKARVWTVTLGPDGELRAEIAIPRIRSRSAVPEPK